MLEVVIATHNLGKVEEFKSLMDELGITFTCLSDYAPVPEPEETGRTFAANARLKARYYAKVLGKICLAGKGHPVSVPPAMRGKRPPMKKTTNCSWPI